MYLLEGWWGRERGGGGGGGEARNTICHSNLITSNLFNVVFAEFCLAGTHTRRYAYKLIVFRGKISD